MEDNIHPLSLNPLTIDVIVPEILRHITSIQDLLAFRQVCRLWREFATPLISSRSLELPSITFNAEVEDVQKDPWAASISLLALSKYIAYLESDFHPKIIFSNLRFDGIWMDHPIVRRFLEEFGHTVKGLRLNNIKMGSYCGNELLLFNTRCSKSGDKMVRLEEGYKLLTFPQLLLSCPDLEELVLSCDLQGNESGGFLMPDDLKTKIKRVAYIQVLQHRPHQHLTVEETFISNLLRVCPSLERFQNVEILDRGSTRALGQSPSVSSLKELELTFGNATAFRALQRDLRLKKLKIRIVRLEDVKELKLRNVDATVQRVLWGQWRRMESLFLENVNVTETVLTGLSPKQISIVDSLINEKKDINIVAENPSILRFKNLKELRIHKGPGNDEMAILTDVSIHSTLSKLPELEFFALNCDSHEFTERGIQHLQNTRGLKWNKNSNWAWLQFQKDLGKEYKPRPACNEEFPVYHTIWG